MRPNIQFKVVLASFRWQLSHARKSSGPLSRAGQGRAGQSPISWLSARALPRLAQRDNNGQSIHFGNKTFNFYCFLAVQRVGMQRKAKKAASR